MGTWVKRYDAGERRQVWDELHAFGALSRAPDEVRRDAEAVARRTMERAASNLRMLHQRLVALDFRFELPAYAFVPPGAEHAAALNALVEKVGGLPASLRALFTEVGYVCFRGWPPSWGSEDAWYAQLLDPFEFLPDVKDEIDRVEDELVVASDRAFRLPIAGDYLHKNDYSGGAATVVPLPSDEADARVVEDDGVWFGEHMANARRLGIGSEGEAEAATPQPRDAPIWLVDYLRMYFDAGGFRRVAGNRTYPEDFTRRLSEGLLEI